MKYLEFDHMGLNVSNLEKSRIFYDKLFLFLGFKRVGKDKKPNGWSNGPNGFWIDETEGKYNKNFHRKNAGVNHLAFRASSKEDVNLFYNEFLLKNKIPVLYGGPKEYPDYRKGYYAVFFEDPDRLKLEIMFFPK
jgi:catechol 2,3-dioxygenase-like lactoylglutathione lyase family enzyme